MTKREAIEKLKAALEQDARRPAKERWDELVARGAIDAEGRVLLRGPGHEPDLDPEPEPAPPPEEPRKAGTKSGR